jgi:hypothetical protein
VFTRIKQISILQAFHEEVHYVASSRDPVT